MKARTWKRIGAGLAVAALATTGYLLWQDRRETAAKTALAAEIRAERAARARPPDPVPTAEEHETAEMYRVAASGLKVAVYLDGGFGGASEAMDGVPWSEVPEPVARMLAESAQSLALADAAEAREVCRFADSSLQAQVSRCTMLLTLLSARGHAALAGGDAVVAAGEVERLLRVGRDLGAAPSVASEENPVPFPYLHLAMAEQKAAALLGAIASAPGLSPEAGPALVDAARAPWGTAAANLRSIDFFEEAADAFHLLMLGPGARAWIDRQEEEAAGWDAMVTSSPSNLGLLEKAEERVRAALRPSTPVPPAATIRWLRGLGAPVVAAARRREFGALGLDGPHEKYGGFLGFLGPRWFRRTLDYEGRIAVARAAAAIRGFQLREGRPPRALEDLVPSLLDEVPPDPLDGKPLLYEVAGEGWRVASRVGRVSADEEEPPVEVRFPRAAK